MPIVLCPECGKEFDDATLTCRFCSAPHLASQQEANAPKGSRNALGWAVVISFVVLLIVMLGAIGKIPGISRVLVDWTATFIVVALICLIWMFASTTKRSSFVKDGYVQLPLFWRQLKSTFGYGVWLFILAFLGVMVSSIIAKVF